MPTRKARRRWLHRLRDWYITRRTESVIADRECRHDGTDPMCMNCTREATGW